jgi:hypothetical protein
MGNQMTPGLAPLSAEYLQALSLIPKFKPVTTQVRGGKVWLSSLTYALCDGVSLIRFAHTTLCECR